MRIIIDILHPAHVHFFRNFISEMRRKGHRILVTARKKDVALDLLRLYKIKYTELSELKKFNLLSLFTELIKRDYKFYKIAKQFKPDITMGIMGATIATAGVFLKAKCIVFYDTEHSKLSNVIVYPLADAVCTPSCYEAKVHGNHIKYGGYHELAYLHPKRFKPDKSILKKVGLREKDRFFVVRFVLRQKVYDIHDKGFANKVGFVRKLEKYGRVFITSETKLPKELEQYKIRIPPHKIHDLLAYATLFIGESATMASEAACLGVPAIFFSHSTRGYTNEEERKYGLVFNFSDEEKAMQKAFELVKRKNLRREWQKKRKKLLKDKIDVTAWMVKFVEDFYKKFKE